VAPESGGGLAFVEDPDSGEGGVKIEDNIPIPPQTRNFEVAEAARAMQIGQSVLCDTESKRWTLISALKRAGRRASVRKVVDGWRVWRVE
jgi:hypothetical protein